MIILDNFENSIKFSISFQHCEAINFIIFIKRNLIQTISKKLIDQYLLFKLRYHILFFLKGFMIFVYFFFILLKVFKKVTS